MDHEDLVKDIVVNISEGVLTTETGGSVQPLIHIASSVIAFSAYVHICRRSCEGFLSLTSSSVKSLYSRRLAESVNLPRMSVFRCLCFSIVGGARSTTAIYWITSGPKIDPPLLCQSVSCCFESSLFRLKGKTKIFPCKWTESLIFRSANCCLYCTLAGVQNTRSPLLYHFEYALNCYSKNRCITTPSSFPCASRLWYELIFSVALRT